ncbi:MAG: hypothetical protein HQK54_04965 [Oligoflexales bacterium]|nr:hypothetical protein [Oligoflexales bacterium]
MPAKTLKTTFLCTLACALSSVMHSPPSVAEIKTSGELAGWGEGASNIKKNHFYSLRYLPEIKADGSVIDSLKWDLDIAGNFSGSHMQKEGSSPESCRTARFYRLWGRLSGEKTEIRAGLQKISFGPGKILRSLKWFDHIDPKDPTQFTLGVYGALYRQYFEDNSNIWIWSLLENSDPMGPVPLTSKKNDPEYGGRVQFPILGGEMGFSAHHRKIDIKPMTGNTPSLSGNIYDRTVDENRVGMDGTWDIGIGSWFEATFSNIKKYEFLPGSILFATLGGDYTIGIYNGLYILAEAMYLSYSSYGQVEAAERSFVVFSPSYPLTILDQIRLIAFRDIKEGKGNYYLDWQRKYDNLLYSVGLFYNETEGAEPLASAPADEQKIQKGAKLLIQFNH